MKIVEIEEKEAWAELSGVRRKISLSLVNDVQLGDFVIVHAGFAIFKLNQEEAERNISLLRELTGENI
jgi:hydrogenase expression/formation protein HypC